MNVDPQAMGEAVSERSAVAPPAITASRRISWSLRRELWENRSLYLAPLAVAFVVLLGFLGNLVHLRQRVAAAAGSGAIGGLTTPYVMAAALLMFTTLVVAAFYCLDALQGERRDRSILFWKSLPVSDLTTVLVKASIPILLLPLLTFVLTVVTQGVMLLLGTLVLLLTGGSVQTLWNAVPLGPASGMLFYHLVMIHGLFFAPFFGWLLLVSAWSRRAAFLWAILPPLALSLGERIAFNTTHFASMLMSGIEGAPTGSCRSGRCRRGDGPLGGRPSPPTETQEGANPSGLEEMAVFGGTRGSVALTLAPGRAGNQRTAQAKPLCAAAAPSTH